MWLYEWLIVTLALFSHCFWDTATYSLKLSIKNCGQPAADEDMTTTDSL